MTIATPPAAPAVKITPEELLAMPDAVDFELVDGQLVERQMGFESSEIAARIIGILIAFLRGKHLGRIAGADGSYQCFPTAPKKVRKPDVSLIRTGRLPNEKSPEGHCPIAPDLAVEVISPNDLAEEVEEKVNEYLAVGVPLIWVVSPASKTVRAHRPGSPSAATVYTATDTITGEDVIPGFTCRVGEFFEPL
ncbi:MAG: Uma2 family endonuclease [Phycisphaerae bacterium]|nr:Uma2 family endonuclease [Tepidisphaeraceae bacterium]